MGGRLRYLRGHGEGAEFYEGAGEGRHCCDLLWFVVGVLGDCTRCVVVAAT